MMQRLMFATVLASVALVAGADPSDYRLPEKAAVVQDCRGYNSWPMIAAIQGRLVCCYSRGSAHTIDEGRRNAYARVSTDGGVTWGPESVVSEDPVVGEVFGGAGVDSTGAALFWVRCWGAKKNRRHDLYRTVDGSRFEKIASLRPDPMPMQVTDPVIVEGVGLVSPWFAGSYGKGAVSNSWGVLVSRDDGRTWEQRVIESGLSVREWVTEPSLANLGDGRLLVIGRCEQNLGNLFQVVSTDSGKTWRKSRTNIGDVQESTPSLVYDASSKRLSLYYYHRGARLLKRRSVSAEKVFDSPKSWPQPEVLDKGFERRAHDAGNVNATRCGKVDFCAWYTGSPTNAAVVVTRCGNE